MQHPLSITRLSEIETQNRQAARRANAPELMAAHTAAADIAAHLAQELLGWLWSKTRSADDETVRAFGIKPGPGNVCRIAERRSGDYLIVRKGKNGPFIKLVKRTGYYDAN